MKKALVVLGPTASGKSSLAVWLAKKISGEVISADSRQVYKGLTIGTGKITKKEIRGVRHHLLDVANPRQQFTVADFKRLAEKAIAFILKRGKIPIICGGTGFYIQALVDNVVLPDVPPNKKLRAILSKKNATELFKILKKLDPARAKSIDAKNPRRLIRAIEIATALGEVPKAVSNRNDIEFLRIGIKTPDKILREKISKRLKDRIKIGMITEAKKLHREGLSWKRMEELGLEYRYLARFLQGKITKEEMISKLETEIWHYAKRQKTWFKRDKRIIWVGLNDKKKLVNKITKFLR